MCISLHVKYGYFCLNLLEPEFSQTDLKKNAPIPNFMNIRPMGAELFDAEGKTERERET